MTVSRACSIPGCEKPHASKGLCRMHYNRLLRHGDPMVAKIERALPGEPQAFYQNVVLGYEGAECLIWPYGRFTNGYGKMDGRIVSRLVCEDVNGPPPTPGHEAAHSCGKGKAGCVTKGHLSWKTKVGNMADKLVHGTHSRGDRHGKAKLTESQAREILSLKGKETQAALAKRFGVATQTVGKIHSGQNWSWLET